VAAGSYDHALQKPYDFMHQFVAYQYLKICRKNETKMIMANMNSKNKIIIERTILLQVEERI